MDRRKFFGWASALAGLFGLAGVARGKTFAITGRATVATASFRGRSVLPLAAWFDIYLASASAAKGRGHFTVESSVYADDLGRTKTSLRAIISLTAAFPFHDFAGIKRGALEPCDYIGFGGKEYVLLPETLRIDHSAFDNGSYIYLTARLYEVGVETPPAEWEQRFSFIDFTKAGGARHEKVTRRREV